ncbi:hypothetical protein MBAV_003354, partial [Candidatus Magnetobacterium bavaricum]
MILKSIDYSENKDTPQYWEIQGVEFGQRNLIVGLNATGKSRLLYAILKLAGFLKPDPPEPLPIDILTYGHWKTQFYDETKDIVVVYEIEMGNSIVKTEIITANGKVVLTRNNDKGSILQADTGRFVEFSELSSRSSLHNLHDPIQYIK